MYEEPAPIEIRAPPVRDSSQQPMGRGRGSPDVMKGRGRGSPPKNIEIHDGDGLRDPPVLSDLRQATNLRPKNYADNAVSKMFDKYKQS